MQTPEGNTFVIRAIDLDADVVTIETTDLDDGTPRLHNIAGLPLDDRDALVAALGAHVDAHHRDLARALPDDVATLIEPLLTAGGEAVNG